MVVFDYFMILISGKVYHFCLDAVVGKVEIPDVGEGLARLRLEEEL